MANAITELNLVAITVHACNDACVLCICIIIICMHQTVSCSHYFFFLKMPLKYKLYFL